MNLRALLAALLLLPTLAHAGHGLMNAFSDVEWLPEPGYMPDHWAYRFERAGEALEFALASPGPETLLLALGIAREKLAECVAMVRAGQAQHGSVARDAWFDAIARAGEAVDRVEAGQPGELEARLVDDLTEQVYILTVEYLDLPLGGRKTVLMPIVDHALRLVGQRKRARDAAGREALFFREEELRWGVEMMQRGDAQGISNAP